jgi:hypothetical protein
MVAKAENHPPVRANGHAVETLQFALQRVQTETRQVHVSDCPGCIEPRQNVAQLADMLGNNPTLIVVFMKAFQSLVAYRPTILSVMRYVTDVYRFTSDPC